MGYLYSAEREASHQLCAVKVLPPDHASHPSLVERFRREIRAMRALRHPCILPIMDAGHEPVHYFTMPFIAGQTLRAAERPTTALGLAECAAVFAPLAEALDEVHQCGFIHRDVKPANIFLTSRGTVLLFDFGIARELSGESTLTEPGVNLGTPAYNAPELYERSETTPRSDQFSLAVVLYEMLTGSLPMGVFRAPRDVCYDLPSASSEAIMRALSHDARDRFDSVRQFAREFFRPLVNRTPIEDFRETIVHLSTQHPSLFDIPPDMAAINASRGRASAFGALIARLVTPGGSRG
jgi:serine/threonine-protein kinase